MFARISVDTSEFDSEIDRASDKANGFGSKLKAGLATAAKVGAAALGAATAAATAFAASSVKVGMDFDSSMSQVAATMGKSMEELNSEVATVQLSTGEFTGTLREFAQEMGANTAFSANEAAQALNYMALAGYDVETSMNMLPNVLNLAAAGGIDLAAASDMVTDAQSALGLSLDETSELVDKMAMASSKSNTSVAQLGDAILTVGGTAKNLAGGTTELSTALGILADNGIKGAEGGTALRNIILSLGAPTDKAAKIMASLGLEVYDAEGKMRPLNETFGDLEAVLSTMTQGEQTQVLNSIFNKVDLKSVNALLANTGERFDELSGYIDDAANSAQKMADTQLDNLTGDVTMFQSALEGAKIVISDGLTPSLRDMVQFGTEAISTLSAAFQSGGLSGAMEALGTLLSDGLTMVTNKLPDVIEAGMSLLGALVEGISQNMPALSDAAVEIILMLAKGLIDGLPTVAETAIEIILALANGLAEALPELVPSIVEVILKIVDTLTDPSHLSNLIGAALAIIKGLADGLIQALPELSARLPEIIGNIVDGLIAAIPQIIAVGAQIVAGLAMGLVQAIPDLLLAIPRLVTSLINGFCELLGIHSPSTVFAGFGVNIVEGLLEGISGAWDTITDFLSGAVETLLALLSEAWSSIAETAGTAWGSIRDVISKAWDGIKSAWSGVTGFFSGIWSEVQGVFGNALSFFSGIGANIVSGLREGVAGAWDSFMNWIGGKVGGIVEGVKSTLGIHSPSTVFAGIGENMVLGLAEGWGDQYSSVKRRIESGLNFSGASIGVSGFGASYNTQNAQQQPISRGGDTFNFYSPKALDPVSAAREMRKAKQQMALGYV